MFGSTIHRATLLIALALMLPGCAPELEITLIRSGPDHQVSLEICQPGPNTPCKERADLFGNGDRTEVVVGLYVDDAVRELVLKFEQRWEGGATDCRQLTVRRIRDQIEMAVRLDAAGDLVHAGCPQTACSVQVACDL